MKYNSPYSQLRGNGRSLFQRSFVAVPFCHTYGMFSLINQIPGGMAISTMRKLSGEKFLQTLERYKIEVLLLVPSLWVFLTKSPLVDKYDLSNVRIVFSGAAALSPEVEEAINKRFENAGVSELNQCFIPSVIGGINICFALDIILPGIWHDRTHCLCHRPKAGEL